MVFPTKILFVTRQSCSSTRTLFKNPLRMLFKRTVFGIASDSIKKHRLYRIQNKRNVTILTGSPWPSNGIPTLLHLAVDRKKIPEIKRLIEEGADVNALGPNGETPLFNGVRSGSPKIVSLLLEKGANPNQFEASARNYNITPFHEALLGHFSQITELFIKQGGVPADQRVLYHDFGFGWPPDSIELAVPRDFKKLTSFKRKEVEKILIFLLRHSGKQFIHHRVRLDKMARKNNLRELSKFLTETD